MGLIPVKPGEVATIVTSPSNAGLDGPTTPSIGMRTKSNLEPSSWNDRTEKSAASAYACATQSSGAPQSSSGSSWVATTPARPFRERLRSV